MSETPRSEDKARLRASLKAGSADRPCSPLEVAELLAIWTRSEPLDAIVGEVGLRDASTLRQFIGLRSLPKEVQQKVIWGRQPGHISFSVAAEIARARGDAAMRALADDAIQNKRSKQDIKRILQHHRATGDPIDRCIAQVAAQSV